MGICAGNQHNLHHKQSAEELPKHLSALSYGCADRKLKEYVK